METAHIQTKFELKAITEEGLFSGYGAVFGNVDGGGDVLLSGAFTETLANLKTTQRKMPVLWQHSPHEPIGVYKTLRQDDYGLFVEGELATKTSRGKDAYELLKIGAVSGMSIGYSLSEAPTYDRDVRKLEKVDLWEISLVTFPMNDLARIEHVKAALGRGDLPSERTFEGLLRDAGFSLKEAKTIISKGFRKLDKSSARDVQGSNDENDPRDADTDESELAVKLLRLLEQLNKRNPEDGTHAISRKNQ